MPGTSIVVSGTINHRAWYQKYCGSAMGSPLTVTDSSKSCIGEGERCGVSLCMKIACRSKWSTVKGWLSKAEAVYNRSPTCLCCGR